MDELKSHLMPLSREVSQTLCRPAPARPESGSPAPGQTRRRHAPPGDEQAGPSRHRRRIRLRLRCDDSTQVSGAAPSTLTEQLPLPLPPAKCPPFSASLLEVDCDREAVQRRSTAKPLCWLDLPSEIRNIIYEYSLDYPDSCTLYSGYNNAILAYHQRRLTPGTDSPEPFPTFSGCLSTPTILLLNRRITSECLPILRCRTLVIDRLPPWVPGQPAPMLVSDFIGRRTLQAARRIDLRLSLGQGGGGSGHVWFRILDDLARILEERNAFVELRVLVRVCNLGKPNIWTEEFKVHGRILEKLDHLAAHNPNPFNPGRIKLDQWVLEGNRAFEMQPDFTVNDPERPDRFYPDHEMWPGSILEFI
ncbi:hypothetical protein NKR23_g9846 [Pleurostoma richardsiae]|uniref:Uncharacterized protein n=1 Tax=Pleurostoma richardsiae TaxID=41990 RepID=A0AA38VJH4_9PEZI|nr:hypothetical protein NKR23_g9846 [Pleurostoma richardsiae]